MGVYMYIILLKSIKNLMSIMKDNILNQSVDKILKMKKIYLLLSILNFLFINAQTEFITTWKPSNPSVAINGNTSVQSTATQIYFPGIGNNYKIYWEEVGYPTHNGTMQSVTSTSGNPVMIDFGTSQNPTVTNATYTVKITATNFSIRFYYLIAGKYYGDALKILEVKQWGNIAWNTMEEAFAGCENLDVTASDLPNLKNVTNCYGMFSLDSKLKGNSSFGSWDMSNVISIGNMFSYTSFNQNIANWNVSKVKSMFATFALNPIFNQPIGNWDTSSVTQMQLVFSGATSFNQPIENWNTANVQSMGEMFRDASSFNQSIGNWDTSKVTDFFGMFWGATSFNQPIGNWNVSKSTDFRYLFRDAKSFNQSINNWDVSFIKDMSCLFYGASSFNKPLNNWNTANVQSMWGMFMNASSFNQSIGNWNTSSVNDMSYMFVGATSFNQSIGNWNTSSVIKMTDMFDGASTFNTNINNWDVSKVQSMERMFVGASNFNQPLDNWNTSSVTNMNTMFFHADSFNQNIGTWNLSKVTDNNSMFQYTKLSCENYDKTLIGWANNITTPNNLKINTYNPTSPLVYSSQQAVDSRNKLINTKGWTISGDTYNAACNPLNPSDTPTAPSVTITQPTCNTSTGTITITPTTGYTYTINNGSSWVATNTFSALASGTYNIMQKNANGYVSPTAVAVINNPPTPTLTLQNATLDMAGSNTVSLAQNQVVVSVADPCDNTPVITLSPNSFNAVGTYTVTVTAKDSYGRTATGTATVTVKDSFANITDLFNIQVSDETCDIKNNGAIQITSTKNLNYSYSLNGGAWLAFTGNTTIGSLNSGAYDLCIKLPSSAQYCYQLQVGKPAKLTGKISSSGKTATIVITNGTAPFTIQYGTKYINVAEKSTVQIPLDDSATEITLTSAKLCEGKITQKVANINNISLYPNPVNDILNISLPSSSETFCKVAIYNTAQQIVLQKEHSLNSNNLLINVNNLPTGEYIIVINFGKTSLTKKFIKQ